MRELLRFFFHSLKWLRRLRKSAAKNGSCGGSAAQDAAKMYTTLWRKSDLEVKIVKDWRCRALFGIQVAEVRTTAARESDLEAKTVKTC